LYLIDDHATALVTGVDPTAGPRSWPALRRCLRPLRAKTLFARWWWVAP